MGLVITTRAKETQKQLNSRTGHRRQINAGRTVLAAAVSVPAVVNDLVPELRIERVAIKRLSSAKRRLRNPGKDHVANVATCIKALGQISPILVDRNWRIVDGHIVIDALKAIGETHVNVVCLDHLNEDQLKLAQVALNKLSEGSVWDLEELRPQLEELQLAGYDLTITGFTMPEIDIITQGSPLALADVGEELEVAAKPVSRVGDLWKLADHRLLCGDALDERSFARVLGMRKADACLTDLPWNIPIENFVSGLGTKKHKDFKQGAGEMTDEEFQTFVDTAHSLIAAHLDKGAVLFSCIDWRSIDRITLGARRSGLTHINTVVWNKGSGGMGGLYRSAHELIPVFCKGKKPRTNNIELGRHGRDRTNVWSYPGANRLGSSAGKALKHHPTPKPVEMVEDAILDVTARGELVLDPFLGSGTTLLAAEKAGRVAAAIELDPAYVDVCIRRWEAMTGKTAVHSESDQTFSEIAVERRSEDPCEEGED